MVQASNGVQGIMARGMREKEGEGGEDHQKSDGLHFHLRRAVVSRDLTALGDICTVR